MADSGRTEAPSTPGPRGIPAAEPVAWRDFAQAATVEEFLRGWLAVQCGRIADVGGGVVFRPGGADASAVTPIAAWGDVRPTRSPLTDAARRALTQRRRVVVQHERDAALRYIVSFPVQAKGQVVAMVAIDLAARPERELQDALRQLEWGSGWLEALALRQTSAGERDAGRERLQMVLDAIASFQGRLRFAEATTAFVTELATRLGCDRVSIGFVEGGRARVRAVSHTADLAGRSNLLRAIGAAMDEAIDQGASIVTPPPSGTARICLAHEELSRQAAGGAACTVPFASGTRIVGALTFERRADRPFDTGTVELAETVAALAGPGLEILRREDRWLSAKAGEAVMRALRRLLGPGHLALKLGTLGVLAAVACLATVTAEYRVTARAAMEASVRRAAVAPFGGYLREAPVRAGDLVRAGQLLAVLDDRDLRLERAKLESQQDQLERQQARALAQSNRVEITIARAQIDQTVAAIALLDQQLGKTRVLAGFDGVVVTGDLSQALGAPVEKGQVLFEIAPLDAYRLIVQVDERDIDDVAVGQRGRLLLTASPLDPVPFVVDRIVPVSIAKEGRNFFRVEARLERAFERLRPGMEGVAKIDVDRRRAAAIWTRSVVDWARLQLWTWSP